MQRDPDPVVRRALPARASLEHLKNEAKQHLKALRKDNPLVKLTAAQLALAREYGFASWRRLKAHVDAVDSVHQQRNRVFAATRAGDIDTVRRALEAGFDPGLVDRDARTIHQIAKADGVRSQN